MANHLMPADFPRLVLDANIMVSALLGKSLPFVIGLFEAGVQLFAPVQQIAETRRILVHRLKLPIEQIDVQLERLLAVVEPLHPDLFGKYESKARSRLGPRGQPDWPVLAATYATGAAAWSHDKDLFGSGAPVWRTKVLEREMKTLNV